NVSLYNETNGRAILPTPVIGCVGLIEDAARAVPAAFRAAGEAVFVVGETTGWLGCSIYQRELAGGSAGAPPPVDLAAERRNGDFVRELIWSRRVSACHDVSDGGMLVAIAEMAMAGNRGATLDLATRPSGDVPLLAWLFGEDQARYVVTAADGEAILDAAKSAGIPAFTVGITGGQVLTLGGGNSISLTELRTGHEGWLPAFMSAG
ncbi:MAG: AIR synthase-related protein, partial [Rhodospirillaceae bacterium]